MVQLLKLLLLQLVQVSGEATVVERTAAVVVERTGVERDVCLGAREVVRHFSAFGVGHASITQF